ncbi:amidohydrolase 3 [Gautieria morchelliformis]|nr:amidohydrolase 3 [Gautieria morchelliformis]
MESMRSSNIHSNGVPRKVKELTVRYTKQGSIVVPGLSDSHGHILEHGKKLQLNLDGLSSPQEAVKRIREYIKARPDILNDPEAWIDGGGWDHTSWPGAKWPTSADLDSDSVVRNRPVVLLSKDGHAFWCSSKAMSVSSPFPDTVAGGVIIRDSEGRPTGTLLDKAMDLIQRPPWSDGRMLEYFSATMEDALSHGLTAIHDAGLTALPLGLLQRLADQNKLPIRIYAMKFLNTTAAYWGNTTSKIIGYGDERLTARSVKIFTDGALRSGGAALYDPYTDNPSTRGFFRTDPELIRTVVPDFLRDGWQVNTHCIGDRANGMFLDLMEDVVKHLNVTALRPRIEHAQIIAPADLSRFGTLGVIASVQPSHVIDDMWFSEVRLGPERIKWTYPFRSLINNGAVLTLGTDFPVADINPLATFYAAITRLSIDGRSPHGPSGWFPEQSLTRQEALRGMTLEPAFASFTESILGSLTPGKRADYVVLSKDILTIPAPDILSTKVLATVLDGRIAYGRV